MPKQTVFNYFLELLLYFAYGFVGNTFVIFMVKQIDFAVFINFIIFYFFLSVIFQRQTVLDNFNKYVLFPIGGALGAYSGYKFALYLSNLI